MKQQVFFNFLVFTLAIAFTDGQWSTNGKKWQPNGRWSAAGQLNFPEAQPSGQVALVGGQLSFVTPSPSPKPVLQGAVSAPAVAPVLIWGSLETKSNASSSASTNVSQPQQTRSGNGDPCPEKFEPRCAPRQECLNRPGSVTLVDPKDPRVASNASVPVPVIKNGDNHEPRIVNKPPIGVVCKEQELYCCAAVKPPPPPPTPTPAPPYKCGVSYTIPLKDYKYGYAHAAFGQYPWIGLIYSEDGEVATGALIDERHVVTVAHKIYGRRPEKIRFGEWDMGTSFPAPYNTIDIPVLDHLIHKDYNPVSLHHDIAILRLKYPLELQKHQHIRTVCLPNPKGSYVGQQCWVAGFGKDAFKSDSTYSRVLQEVDLPVMDGKECENRLREKTQLGSGFLLNENNHNSFLCAGGIENGKDTCTGDGGAPLVCKNSDNQFEAVGLVSWGIGCGKPGVPGVYLNLANYVDWIQEMIET